MRFTLKIKDSDKSNYRLIDDLPGRAKSFIEHYPFWIAEEFHKQLLTRGPDDIPNYINKLKLMRFRHSKADHVFGVVLPGYEHSSKLKTDDAKRTVLYIGQKRRTQPDPGVAALERYNPWTMDTLPYEAELATTMSRRVSERETNIIRERRLNDREHVDAELRALGIQPNRSHPTLLSRKVSRDIVFEALRREYGVGGEPHQPHLRVALSKIQREIEPRRLFGKLAVLYLSKPQERRWKKPLRVNVGKNSITRRSIGLQDFILGDGNSNSLE
jgi:hypothetical protein